VNDERPDVRSAPVYTCDECKMTFQLQQGYEKVLKVVCPRCGKPPATEASRTVTR
jgi:transcription initiation factor IIE alpha subunit